MAGDDLIALIETAYETGLEESAWMARLSEVMAPVLAGGAPFMGFFFQLDETRQRIHETELLSTDERFTATALTEMHERRAGLQVREAYECEVLCLLSKAVGEEVAQRTLAEAGLPAKDMLGLRCNDQARSGVLFTTPAVPRSRIPRRDSIVWPRIAAHVGAGLRLKRRMQAPEQAAAILSPDGELAHGDVHAVAAREQLREATRTVDRARGKLRRLDPDAAIAAWEAMVHGDWTLCDWFDHDGKRFVVAHDNRQAAAIPERAELSDREQQALACAAMGHSNKLIAYDLGLSAASISTYLRRAAEKLGATSRVSLIEMYRARFP